MTRVQDRDTRYFVEIDLSSKKIVKCGYDQKQNLDKGRQSRPDIHRLFVTKGQYDKLISRCAMELGSIIEAR